MSILYSTDTSSISERDLSGFFEGWATVPSLVTHLATIRSSYRAVIATDEDSGRVIGFVTCISDGQIAAYLPLLEVLPQYRGAGVGVELVTRMLAELEGIYMVDLCCDEELVDFYRRFPQFDRAVGMVSRNYQALRTLG